MIGGIWNPAVEAPRPWKVGLGFPCRPVAGIAGDVKDGTSSKLKVELDKSVLLRDLERIGKGLILDIEFRH